MRAHRWSSAVVALCALCIGLLGAAQPARAATFVPIAGAGSTWSYDAIHQWIDAYCQAVGRNPCTQTSAYLLGVDALAGCGLFVATQWRRRTRRTGKVST